MTDLLNLDFRDHPIRVVMIGEDPHWVIPDVCGAVDIKNARDAATRLHSDDVAQTDIIDSMGRTQTVNVVNESGLYELIFRSDKPAARDFRRWVTRDVLPQIRKTGAYVEREMSPDLQRIYDLVMVQARQEAEIRRTQRQIAATAQQVVGVSARVESVEDRVLDLETISPLADAAQLHTLRDLAHACGTGQNRMKKWLIEQGVMFRDHQNNDRIKQHPWQEDGMATDRYEKWSNGQGWSWVPYFTPLGMARIKRLYDGDTLTRLPV